jgi:hypothetical protein
VKEYGAHKKIKQLFKKDKYTGIIFLNERTYRFTLQNGTLLTVYASLYTPALGAWEF